MSWYKIGKYKNFVKGVNKVINKMKVIKFYKVNEPFGCFSNFSPHPIFINNERWNTVEHYFQASKFCNIEVKEKIQQLESPMKAAIEGRNKKNKLREDWEVVKEDVMYKALKFKFMQHPMLLHKLLMTDDQIIIEHTENDNYWADGGDGNGQNRLGVLLMKLREEFLVEIDDKNIVLPPWIAFPTISPNDLFWRMGLGEDYLSSWVRYYESIDRVNYREKYPVIKEWEEFYD
ncbi:MAG: NADAR family protein [Flavobacteriaceae bacterium]|jgi:ribA/ribD-fused uncharacterized protein|nr:NADAR family protein [Flavobacteriaceae bacterium]